MSATATDPITRYVHGKDFRLLIGGEMREAATGLRMETIDPSTGEAVASVPEAGADDVAAAYDAAANARADWEALGIEGRAEIIYRAADAIEANETRLAMLDAIDGGLPFPAAREDIVEAVASLRQWPALVRWHGGRTIPASRANLHYTSRRAYGVVGRILAYNHPAYFAISTVPAALLAGNTVIVKPAPQAPLSALALGEVLRDVFPAGVMNVLSGGVEAGDAIVTHPGIKRIGFTGSAATGRTILQRAASIGIKHVSLELGGKNAMIVFPDADMDRAVNGAVNGMNFGVCAGQSCGSNSRTFVHESVYEEFLERVAARLDSMRVGSAYADAVDIGPLITQGHYDRVSDYVRSGTEEGARLITGGIRPDTTGDRGYFLRPTLFADVTSSMRIGRDEIFGPVMSMAPWRNTDEVVARANETEYGLTASVWTRDLDTAHRTADAMQAGYVWINHSAEHYFGTPFGGFKNSGLGREESIEEYESYQETKAVHLVFES